MGADLLIANVWAANPPSLDFEAGKRVAQTLAEDAVNRLREQAPYLDEQDDDAVRERAADLVEEMAQHFGGGFTRNLVSFTSPDGRWTCWLTGGMSWGDSPSELFDAINDLWAVPEVLAAIGFVTGNEVTA